MKIAVNFDCHYSFNLHSN